jgi:arylsulfatase A-like enzyme
MEIRIDRRQFNKYLGVCLATGLSMRAEGSEINEKPNILYIFADQMRFSAMNCMSGVAGAGGEPESVNTPNLNKVAQEGVLFTHAFSTTPVCSPYRVGLQTGKYCHKVGYSLDPKETTLAHVLEKQGYSTGYIGKWHMHGTRNNPRGFVEPDRRVGWQFFAGSEVTHQYFNTYYYLNNDRTPVPVKNGAYEAEVQTDLAISFLERQNKKRPFCLFLSWGPPHNPYAPPKKFDTHKPEDVHLRPNVGKEYKQKAAEQLAKYYGQIESLDYLLGRILKCLDEQGIADNTILCFSSDHGDMHYSHKHEEPPQGSGYKRRPYEEAARIPFIMRWPRIIKKGRKTDMLFGSVNVMPTLLGLCDAPIPDGVQGEDCSDAILNNKQGPESVFLQQTAPGNTPFGSTWRAIRTRKHLYAISGHTNNGGWLLYDMENDPYQMKNLIDDPAYDEIRKTLDTQLNEWRKKTGDDQALRKRQRSERKELNRKRNESS